MLRVEQIMGMPIEIDVRDTGVDQAAVDRAFDWLRGVDETFSTYKPESQISRLNAGFSVSGDMQKEVEEVLQRCAQLREETNGYFAIETTHLPVSLQGRDGDLISHGLDPSGLVKGWSVDQAGAILTEAGARNFSINAGGDVRVRGGALPETCWRVGIRHPIERDKLAAVVETSDLAIATSGAYERGQHIIDPHTGVPPTGILSVTIVGRDLGTADAFATAAFAMGEDGPRWTMTLADYESMTILEEGSVLLTPGFPKL